MFNELTTYELFDINGGTLRDACGVIVGIAGGIVGAAGGGTVGITIGTFVSAISINPAPAIIGGVVGIAAGGYYGYKGGKELGYQAYDTIASLFN